VNAPSFEDKLSKFLKDSDERLTDLKKNTDSKRGGRGGARRAE
jgi:S1 RNA binding domain protein